MSLKPYPVPVTATPPLDLARRITRAEVRAALAEAKAASLERQLGDAEQLILLYRDTIEDACQHGEGQAERIAALSERLEAVRGTCDQQRGLIERLRGELRGR